MNKWTPERIKKLRTRLNLTQKAFGELVGVTSVYVSYLEKGEVKTPGKTLCILLDCIDKRTKGKEV